MAIRRVCLSHEAHANYRVIPRPREGSKAHLSPNYVTTEKAPHFSNESEAPPPVGAIRESPSPQTRTPYQTKTAPRKRQPFSRGLNPLSGSESPTTVS